MSDYFDNGRYKLIDTRTGEFIDVQVLLDKVERTDWEIAYVKTLAEYMNIRGTSVTKVLSYLLKTKDGGNRIHGTQEEIAADAGVSVPTVKTVFKALLEKGFIKRIRNGLYMVTPKVMRNGNKQRGAMLLRLWDDI
jgi:DNA-binding MarR family transcriptional regulator